MPFFSIIIPVYNVAPYLRECLDSVLAQAFTDWEAICVDDGSTDGSGAILDECAARDSRFRVIHQPNAGVGAARNAALDVAQGEWVCFLDADDVVQSEWLKDINSATVSQPAVNWVRTRFCHWYQDDRGVEHWPKGYPHYEPDGLIQSENLVKEAWARFSHLGLIVINVFRRDLIGKVRFPIGLVWMEDVLFCIMVAGKATLCSAIKNDDYWYRIRIGSASHLAHPFLIFVPILDEFYKVWALNPGEVQCGTYLIKKIFLRLSRAHGRYTWRDGLKLRKQLKSIEKIGGFSCGAITEFNDRLRWRLFMFSGHLGFLAMPINPVRFMRMIVEWVGGNFSWRRYA